MAELLERKLPTDCVFAMNDAMAVGAMTACRDHDVDVPGDLAIAGFDDIAPLRDVTPGLTTVRLPLARISALALGMAVTGDRDAVPRVRRSRGEVVVRASTPGR